MELFNLNEKANTELRLSMSEIGLITLKKESKRVSGNEELWGSVEEHMTCSSPFAIANNSFQSSTLKTLDGKPSTDFFTSSSTMAFARIVSSEGMHANRGANSISMGIVPTVSLPFDSKNPREIFTKEYSTGTKRHYTTAGHYLNTNATNEQNQQFETLFNGGQVLNGMKPTGNWITTSGHLKNVKSFVAKQVPIFEIEVNGKTERWGRVSENVFENKTYYHNGTKAMGGGAVRWFKVEPVLFEVLNHEEIKNGTATFYELKAAQAIISNIPLSYNGNTLFESSTIRAWLNGIKTNGGDFTHTTQTLENGEVVRRGYGSFLEDCFSFSPPISHFVVPSWQTEIPAFAFRGACHLKTLTIPSTVLKIGEGAFLETQFSYISKNNLGEKILSTSALQAQNIIYSQNISNWVNALNGFDITKIITNTNLGELNQLVEILNKNKSNIPSVFAEKLLEDGVLNGFIQNADFRFFKNEVLPQLAKLKTVNNEEKLSFYKFANALGCFSAEKITNELGEQTQTLVAQKASSLLFKILKNSEMKIGNFEKLFKNLPTDFRAGKDFIRFISEGESGFEKLNLLLQLENKYSGIFTKSMVEFDTVKQLRQTINENPNSLSYGRLVTLSWEEVFVKHFVKNSYENVTLENSDLAEVLAVKGFSQDFFDKANELRLNAQEHGVVGHILGKHLKEETILSAIEKIKENTALQLYDSQHLIEELYEKKFTYEFLNKLDPVNPIIGVFASCCATIGNVHYGKEIAKHSIISNNVQNLVVRDLRGEIVGKGSIYVNGKLGYSVINNFEINSVYKNKEDKNNHGYYSVPSEHKDEQDRSLIFDAFERGVLAFVSEYDKQNPTMPMKIVSVGFDRNKLKKQLEHFKTLEENKLHVPIDYYFIDALITQKVLYDAQEVKNNLNAEKGGRK